MKRVAAISSNVAKQMAHTSKEKPQIITVKMRYDTSINEFIRMNKEAYRRTASSRLKVR